MVSCILTTCCLACTHLATSPNLAWSHCILAIYGMGHSQVSPYSWQSALVLDKWDTVAANDYPPLLYLFGCQIVAQISAVIGWALHWYIYTSIPWSAHLQNVHIHARMSTASSSWLLLGLVLHGIMPVPLVSHSAVSANNLLTCTSHEARHET